MPNLRRSISLLVNVPRNYLRDSAEATGNGKGDQSVDLFLYETVLLKAQLFEDDDDAATPYALEADTEFYFAIDSSFDPVAEDPVATLDANINDTDDWADASSAAGKIGILVNLNTESLIAQMEDSPSKNMHMVLWAKGSAVDATPFVLFHLPVTVRGVVASPEGLTSGATPSSPSVLGVRRGTADNDTAPENTTTFSTAFPTGAAVVVVAMLRGAQNQARWVEVLSQDETGFTWRVQNLAGIDTDDTLSIAYIATGA